MRHRFVLLVTLLALGAGFGLAQDGPPPGDRFPDLPAFRSTTPVPNGSIEIVRTDPGTGRCTRGNSTEDLIHGAGSVVGIDDGLTLGGPLQVAVLDGVQILVEDGAELRLTELPGGGVHVATIRGRAYTTNGTTSLRLGPGAGVDVTPADGYATLTGDAAIELGGVELRPSPRLLARSQAPSPGNGDAIPPNNDPVGPFRPFR